MTKKVKTQSSPVPTNGTRYPSTQPKDQYSRAGLSNFKRSLKRHRKMRQALFAVVPPAQPLVGVETNPGPPKRVSARGNQTAASIARDAAVLGAAVAQAQIARTRKKKKKNGSRLTGESVSANPTARSLTSMGIAISGPPMRSSAMKQVRMRMPFNVFSNSVGATAGATVSFGSNPSLVAGTNALDLSPVESVILTNINPVFGAPCLKIAKAFQKYRLLKLKVIYKSVLPTTAAGALIMGYSKDPFINGAVTISAASSLETNECFNVWQSCEFDVPNLDTTEKFMWQSGTTASEDRLQVPGALCVISTGTANSTVYGLLYLQGEIEFIGIGDEEVLQAPVLKAAPRDDSSSSPPLAQFTSVPSTPGRWFVPSS